MVPSPQVTKPSLTSTIHLSHDCYMQYNSTSSVWPLRFRWTVYIYEAQHQTHCPSSRPCLTFCNIPDFMVSYKPKTKPQNWRTTLCQLSIYYIQLVPCSISTGWLHPQHKDTQYCANSYFSKISIHFSQATSCIICLITCTLLHSMHML